MLLARRSAKELLRDPLTLFFGLGFPLVVLALLSAIQKNVPVPLFAPEKLGPGVTIFGLSFVTLFAALLVSKDRSSALLLRLYTTPLRPVHYIFGYLLPLLPLALAQSAVCCAAALVLGLPWRWSLPAVAALNLPAALLFGSLGLLCGSLLTDKQVGGICGALITNLTAWLSGIWFDLSLVGGVYETLAKALPFYHAVELARAVYAGALPAALPHLWMVLAWAAALTTAAVWAFLRQMRKN
ncbi:MAG: ABC transporter permease [Oscillospiraceae bacterium]|nr:ABC transporter permease [Oscillospiraceae bacterium]